MNLSVSSNQVLRANDLISSAKKFRGGRIGVELVLHFAAWAIFLSAVSFLAGQAFSFDVIVLVASAALGIVSTAAKFVLSRRLMAYDGVALAEKLNGASRWNGPNRIAWAVFLGASMAAVVGVTIGSLNAFSGRPGSLIGGSRTTTIIAWIVLSLLWATPAAFAVTRTQRRSPPSPHEDSDAD